MVYIIVRKTRRERDDSLRESASKSTARGVEGEVRRTEEAMTIEHDRTREGKPFNKPYAVSAASPEAKQAEEELLLRTGIDPDRYAGRP